MDSSMRSTSTVVFNRLVIFVLKEANQIFRQLLGVSRDAELTSGAVKRQPRYALSLLTCQHTRQQGCPLWSCCAMLNSGG